MNRPCVASAGFVVPALALEYESGHTIAELESQFKLSNGAILCALHRAGVEMRAKAPRRTQT